MANLWQPFVPLCGRSGGHSTAWFVRTIVCSSPKLCVRGHLGKTKFRWLIFCYFRILQLAERRVLMITALILVLGRLQYNMYRASCSGSSAPRETKVALLLQLIWVQESLSAWQSCLYYRTVDDTRKHKSRKHPLSNLQVEIQLQWCLQMKSRILSLRFLYMMCLFLTNMSVFICSFRELSSTAPAITNGSG